MSTREQYRGMSIRSIARPLKDGSGWTSEVLVAEEIGSETLESRFVLKPNFFTEQIAHGSAMATGRRVVDDKIRGLDIRAVIEEQTRLPSTHRSSFGSGSDDVALGDHVQVIPETASTKTRWHGGSVAPTIVQGVSRGRVLALGYETFRATA